MDDERSRVRIACTLSPVEAAAQVGEWERLRRRALRIERITAGIVLVFDSALADQVEDLAAREAQCCAFLRLEVTRSADEVRLAVTADDPGAGPVVAMLTGAQP